MGISGIARILTTGGCTVGACFLFRKTCAGLAERDLHGVLPSFSRSLKINMAAAIGVHLGYTCASLAIYKVENQLF